MTNICNYKFICSTIVWYDVLAIINPVSKQLQSINFDLKSAVETVKTALNLLQVYRNDGFNFMTTEAKEMSLKLGITLNFVQEGEIRRRIKKKAI